MIHLLPPSARPCLGILVSSDTAVSRCCPSRRRLPKRKIQVIGTSRRGPFLLTPVSPAAAAAAIIYIGMIPCAQSLLLPLSLSCPCAFPGWIPGLVCSFLHHEQRWALEGNIHCSCPFGAPFLPVGSLPFVVGRRPAGKSNPAGQRRIWPARPRFRPSSVGNLSKIAQSSASAPASRRTKPLGFWPRLAKASPESSQARQAPPFFAFLPFFLPFFCLALPPLGFLWVVLSADRPVISFFSGTFNAHSQALWAPSLPYGARPSPSNHRRCRDRILPPLLLPCSGCSSPSAPSRLVPSPALPSTYRECTLEGSRG